MTGFWEFVVWVISFESRFLGFELFCWLVCSVDGCLLVLAFWFKMFWCLGILCLLVFRLT